MSYRRLADTHAHMEICSTPTEKSTAFFFTMCKQAAFSRMTTLLKLFLATSTLQTTVFSRCIDVFTLVHFQLTIAPACRSLWRTRRDPAGSVRQLARKLRRPEAHCWFCRHQWRRPSRETGRRHVRVPVQGHCWISYRSVGSRERANTKVLLADASRKNSSQSQGGLTKKKKSHHF